MCLRKCFETPRSKSEAITFIEFSALLSEFIVLIEMDCLPPNGIVKNCSGVGCAGFRKQVFRLFTKEIIEMLKNIKDLNYSTNPRVVTQSLA